MAAPALPTSGLIDPTKQAEYPIVLGDRLAGKGTSNSQLVNIQYNYKTKSATARSKISRSRQSRDRFNLTITDKAPNAEQNVLTYTYQGSVDPAQAALESAEHNLVLVFDANRKVFVLEPVTTQLNFNLRSAPAKSHKQVLEQYEQLRMLQEEDHGSGDDRASDNASGNDDGPADDNNPFDFRHFLPKENADDDRSASDTSVGKAATPLMSAIKPTPSPKPLPDKQKQREPLLRKKERAEAVKHPKSTPTKAAPKSPAWTERKGTDRKVVKEDDVRVSTAKPPPAETGLGLVSSQITEPSPGSNIIIDGDLIIEMGSPRPSRIDTTYFSDTHTPASDDHEEEDDEDVDHLRLPSPTRHGKAPAVREPVSAPLVDEDELDDDDALAAEMEAAFEESAREEEEARSHQSQPPYSSHLYHAPSDDESESSSRVTEEYSIGTLPQACLRLDFADKAHMHTMASPRGHRPSPRPVPAPSNSVLLATQAQWLFTDEELTRTPSQLDGMKMEAENTSRSKGVNFISQVGIMLKLPQLTLATAAVYLHRFFMRYSMVDLPQRPGMHPYPIAATALMKELVVACCRVAQKQPNLVVDEQSKEFWKWRDTILVNEDTLLEALCFDLQLEEPYRILYEFLLFFGVADNKQMRNASWAFFTARNIAAAALYAAAKHCDVGFEDDELGRPWWEQIDVDINEVRRTVTRMAQLYENNALQRNTYYLSAPTASDEGTEKTRIPRAGGTTEPAPGADPVNGRKRSREPEEQTHDRNLHESTTLRDHEPNRQNGVVVDRGPAHESSTIPHSNGGPPASQDRHHGNGHVSAGQLPPPPHHSQPRHPHPLPPAPRPFPRRDSASRGSKPGQPVDPIQQRIDEIVQQNMSSHGSPSSARSERRPIDRHRSDWDVESDERRRRPSAGGRKPSYEEHSSHSRAPPPPAPPPPPPPPPPEEARPPSPKPTRAVENDDEGGGSEEGEL
ncbi:hypothetical protein BO86DRAFT_414575 [Aspergillus japonicus CBS 114.51]|uniref:Transcription elongation factor Eaf N-terminal domain-containing protein n=1 Tax=Aspergillus japonicus CBS 114.51 TaxID=1448312 RepID=A0A8T8XIU8_ASPJA|nr:hypothetical protein BO86DRAFT_414575 [Aspergillus japonicus CBS 114.51]RAH87459.1 hypothetical protein BO86DRAFT_414575 [Aspergillus japonicus CBS 114.51]